MNFESQVATHPASTRAERSVGSKEPILWDKTVVRQLLRFPSTRVIRPERATTVGVRDRSIRLVENSTSPEHRGSLLDCTREKDVHANFTCGLVIDSHVSPVRLSLLWVDRKLRQCG